MVHRCSLDYHTLAEPVLRAEQRERSSSRGEVGLEVVHVLGLRIPSVLTCGSAHLNTRVCLKHGSIIAYRLENVCMWPKKPIVHGSIYEFGYIRTFVSLPKYERKCYWADT